MGKTNIEWATDVWNPVTGCTKVSEGCRHCYAERIATRFPREGFEAKSGSPLGTSRFADVLLHPGRLGQPLKWRKPRRVFVNSMSDLFHRDIPADFIRAVFSTMASAKQHAFIVLTKRPERMLDILSLWTRAGLTLREGCGVALPNVWLGVSVEDQKTADERIPLLLQTPAAKRFVSYEPALGPVDLSNWLPFWMPPFDEIDEDPLVVGYPPESAFMDANKLNWVICGGESGPGARPCEVRWLESVVDQCALAGVPPFLKQLGADPRWAGASSRPIEHSRGKNADPSQWPESLRVQEVPNA